MDVDVFKQRFLPFHPKLYRIAYALLDNKADAEDILQDAYCKLWNKRDELGDIQNPEAFSITLVKNLCLDFLRSPKASRRDNEEALDTVLLTTDSSPEKELEEKEDIRRIQELIEQLPENQRQVIRYLESMEYSFRTVLLQYQEEEGTEDIHAMLKLVEEVVDMVFFGVVQRTETGSGQRAAGSEDMETRIGAGRNTGI